MEKKSKKRVQTLFRVAKNISKYSALDLAQKYNSPYIEDDLYIMAASHQQEKFLKSLVFDIKNLQENQSIGTFGLTEEDEDEIDLYKLKG